MKRFYSVLLVLILLAFGASASAQETAEEPPAPPDAEETREATEVDEVDEVEAEAWTLLERALNALAQRDDAAAKRYLERLHANYPDHPAAEASADALETLGGERPSAFLTSTRPSDESSEKKRGPEEDATGIARAELAIFQTINGLAVGAELCGVAVCDDPRLVIGSLAGGAGLGLGLSLYASRDGITPGHALAINSGTFWGAVNGGFLDLSLGSPNAFPNRRAPALLAGGQLAGMAVGHLAYANLEPDAGDVALMNTTGLWSGVMMMLVNGIVFPEQAVFARSTLAAVDLGLIGGAVLSKYFPMSRGRAFVIDAGGLVGALTGVGAYLFFTGGDGESEGGFTSALVGAGAGLGLSTYFTRNWDEEEDLFGDVHMMFAPSHDGKGGVMMVGGTL
ncbi:MAG: tetratricopeptide repeat protein [Myxococcota bacterium]